MSSRNPYDDELGQLIRNTLEMHVARKKPSPWAWTRIKLGLGSGKVGARYFFSLGVSVVTQVVLILMLLGFGEAKTGKWMTVLQTGWRAKTATTLVQYVASAEIISLNAVHPGSGAETPALVVPVEELQLLKMPIRFQPEKSSAAPNETPPLPVPPVDVIPHANSPTARSLAAERQMTEALFKALSALQYAGPGGGTLK